MDHLNAFVNKIVCGSALDVMAQLPDKSVNLILTSPPYNLKNSTGNGMRDGRGGRWQNAKLINGYDTHADNMSHVDYVEWQRKCLSEMMRVLSDDGAIFYNHKWRVQGGLLQDRSDIVNGFPVRQVIIWNRKGGLNFNKGYFLPTYEVVYLIAKPNFKLKDGASSHGDIWTINPDSDNKHPAPFPLELAHRVISSTDAKVILDSFCGSGTTALAAINNERDFICCDKSEYYCEIARDRIKEPKTVRRTHDNNYSNLSFL